ncbi:MAG: long-chain fatty acid--CoA ligase [Aeriscardovia sp.]|nr:long-chain fatty acid--CoA ligase [Aeriscardovia sp.]
MKKESASPLVYETSPGDNLFSILQKRAEGSPEGELIKYKDKTGGWQSFSAGEFLDLVKLIAKGLISKGFKKGDAIAILSSTRWEWTAFDFAALSIGMVVVPIYQTDSPIQIKSILNDTGTKILVAEDEIQREKIVEVEGEVESLESVWLIDKGAVVTFCELGKGVGEEEWEKMSRNVKAADLATIVYTSGSTGEPKGAELTHAMLCCNAYSICMSVPQICYQDKGCYLCFLPLAHIFARAMQFAVTACSLSLALEGGAKTLLEDFRKVNPTLILGVPRVFEKIYNASTQRAEKAGKTPIFKKAVKAAKNWSKYQQKKSPMPSLVEYRKRFYSKLVYKKILRALGNRASFAVTGGAPIDRGLSSFFNGIGLPLLEGYGLTETCPCVLNPVEGYKVGSAGKPIASCKIAVSDEGEVLVKGPMVFRGYHNDPGLTKEVLDQDGWFHTGDLGQIDEDGFLFITGRKKELIITAGGKNVYPALLETAMKTCPLVEECALIGDKKPFVSALFTLNLEAVNKFLSSKNLPASQTLEEASQNPLVYNFILRAVDKANEKVSRAESIRKFLILPSEFSVENGLLTPSMKICREKIAKKFKKEIEEQIYSR